VLKCPNITKMKQTGCCFKLYAAVRWSLHNWWNGISPIWSNLWNSGKHYCFTEMSQFRTSARKRQIICCFLVSLSPIREQLEQYLNIDSFPSNSPFVIILLFHTWCYTNLTMKYVNKWSIHHFSSAKKKILERMC